jgi:hypothetical protein
LDQLDNIWRCPTTRPADQDVDWESLDFMHAWMDNLMPGRASTHVGGNVEGVIATINQDYDDEDRGVRIRTEAGAADLLDILGQPAPATPDATIDLRRRDRQMMGASNLVVGCPEFVVDYTFGTTSADDTNPATGSIHWYGPETACGFYEYGGPPGADDCSVRLGTPVLYRNVNGAGNAVTPILQDGYPITDRMVYGFHAAADQYRNAADDPPFYPLSVSSFFGTIDPTYSTQPGRNILGGPGESVLVLTPTLVDPQTGEVTPNNTPAERAWRWPRMVRIRVTIADPIEKGVEATFEYVFSIPDNEPRS